MAPGPPAAGGPAAAGPAPGRGGAGRPPGRVQPGGAVELLGLVWEGWKGGRKRSSDDDFKNIKNHGNTYGLNMFEIVKVKL